MSASDWKACPRCAERAEKAFEEAKENPEIGYGAVKMLEELKEAYRKGYPRHKDELYVEIDLTTLEKVSKITGFKDLYPSDGKLRPVRVDKNITLNHDRLNMFYKAECWNCGYIWEVNDKFEGETGDNNKI